MKVPLSWLKEYVDLDISVEKLADALSLSGSEVEKIHKSSEYKNVVVGRILEVRKHPNADRLKVCKAEIAPKKVAQIVCGAPNVEKGQNVPVALPGAELGKIIIKKTIIRGIESSGMICAEDELGISEDHEGIMVLAENIKPGTPFSDTVGGDTVLEIDLTPNRSDCYSIIGIAREAAASLGKSIKGTNFKKSEACPSDRRVKSSKKVDVEVEDKDLCPRYIAKVVEGVKIGPSPKWMQDRLSAAGVRPINNVVDVTNYVMLEWGQPLHAFDYEKLTVNRKQKTVIVRRAKAVEKIITLDGVDRILTTSDLIIADTKKPVAIAGVMGGANSEVDEKSKTIILEAAVFDRTSIRKTTQRLGLRSEASNRFEKGVPLNLPEIAIERAAMLIEEICKGTTLAESGSQKGRTLAGENTDVLSRWIWTQHVGMRLSRAKKFLGIDIPEVKVIEILKSLGFEAERFDFKAEARKHVGKPYVFGTSFKTHGAMAFDCSYLTDYIYSQIGKFIGYTSLAQYELGRPVNDNELLLGDILFVKGHIDKSVTDHYFVPDSKGGYQKIVVKPSKEVGHNGIYIGGGRVIHARHYEYDKKTGKWVKNIKEGKVVEEDVSVYTKNPEYLGARRYIDDPDDYIAITVPWWRLDVRVEEDIFEEIGRIYGYNNFPSTLPSGELPVFSENKKLKLISDIKNVLVGAGLTEVYNYSFVSAKVINESGELAGKALKIANPISPDQQYMRTNLIGSLLLNAKSNQDNFDTISIFEIASIYLPVPKESLPREIPTLAILIKSQKGRDGNAFYRIKGSLELVAKKLNLIGLEYKKENPTLGRGKEPKSVFEKGRTSSIFFKGTRIGVMGEISEIMKNSFGLKYDFAVLQINLNPVAGDYGQVKKYRSISKYPESARDISLVFDDDISAAKILEELDKSKNPLLVGHEILDIYKGKEPASTKSSLDSESKRATLGGPASTKATLGGPASTDTSSGGLPDGKKSVTIRLVFGSSKETLNEEKVSLELSSVVNLLKKSLGGTERF